MTMPRKKNASRNPKAKRIIVLTRAVVGSLIALAGCGKPVSTADLPGTFLADYAIAKERLILSASGTFTQTVVLTPSGQTNRTSGTFRYDSSDGRIVFDRDFLLVLDGFGQLRTNWQAPANGLVILPVTRTFGTLSIGTSDGVVYRKQDD